MMMVLAGLASYGVRQYVMDRARFEILDTDLQVEDGYLSGSLSFRCSRLDERDNIEYADTVLRIDNIADTTMDGLKSGDEFFVHYRERDFGPLKHENRYVIFMVRELGILKEEIVGFVQLDGWAEVVIRGKARDLP